MTTTTKLETETSGPAEIDRPRVPRRTRTTRLGGPRQGRTTRRVTHLLIIPLLLVWIYPYVWSVVSSVRSQREMLLGGAGLIPQDLTLANYSRAWEQAKFAQYTLNSTFVTLMIVALTIVICSTAGYALARTDMPGRRLIIGVMVATMFLPKGFTIIPLYVLIDVLGLNNTLWAIIVTDVGTGNVVPILLYMGYFASLPRELEEAARVDGAGFVRTFVSIIFPLAKPVTATVSIFTFIAAWNAFLVPLVFTLNRPDLRTIGVGIYAFVGENSTDWAGLAAASVISVVPVIAVFLWLQRYFIDGIAGSIKG